MVLMLGVYDSCWFFGGSDDDESVEDCFQLIFCIVGGVCMIYFGDFGDGCDYWIQMFYFGQMWLYFQVLSLMEMDFVDEVIYLEEV